MTPSREPVSAFLAAAALFASGAAALMYEVAWIRQSSLVFGSTTFALSTVLAVFFLGLAAGSHFFGRLAGRLQRPLLLFALLEMALGAFALLSPWLFNLADALYGLLYRGAPDLAWLRGPARTALVGVILLPATVIMGATLPLFCRQFAPDKAAAGRRVGLLYGINTLGAATGAATAGFLLLPKFGLALSVQTASALSLLVGACMLLLPATHRPLPAAETSAPAPADAPSQPEAAPSAAPALLLYFGVGFVALGLQVVWYRFLSLVIRQTVETYTLVLTVVLLGIVAGSWLAAWRLCRRIEPARAFGTLQILSALSVAGLLALPAHVWWAIGSDLRVCALLLFVPSLLSGASFPLAVRMVLRGERSTAASAGSALAANTLGGVLGALALGFLVLPNAGLHAALCLTTLPSLLIGAMAWRMRPKVRPGTPAPQATAAWALAGTATAIWLLLIWTSRGKLPAEFLVEPGNGELVAYREGYGANLAAVRRGEVLVLEIDRWWQGEDRRNHQALSAHIPALLHPDPKDVLLVGVGTGQTASRFLMHGIRSLDCIDIEPAIFPFVHDHFDPSWAEDARTRLIVEDGRLHLRHGRGRYDIISLELGQIFRPGVASFYTAEAYAQARRQLKPGGLLVQFLPLPFFTREQFQAAVATFLEVFPESVLWFNTSEVLLIGANAGRFPFPPDLAAALGARPAVVADLDHAYWGGPAEALHHPEVFVGGFLAGPRELAALARGGRCLSDDRPWLDHATAGMHHLEGREIALAAHLREHLGPLPAALIDQGAADFAATARRIQIRNLGDIAASALLRQAAAREADSDIPAAMAALAEALRWNPGNAEARIRLGDAFLRRGDPVRARDHFADAARILPDDPRPFRGWALSLHRVRLLEEAIAIYKKALHLDPANAELHNNLGAALAESGRFEEARIHFEHAVQLRPDYEEAARNLARIDAIRPSDPSP